MGWDKHYGFQLYQSDPSGNYGGWKATCIGNNSSAAISMLKQDYKDGDLNLQQALDMAIKVLSKTLDMTKLSADKGITNVIVMSVVRPRLFATEIIMLLSYDITEAECDFRLHMLYYLCFYALLIQSHADQKL